VSRERHDRYSEALLDWMACAAGGLEEPAARAARNAGDGRLDRVTAAATAGHVLDFDDTYLPGVAHLSAPTAPAALVVGAEVRAGVGEVLSAYSAGFEATGALALAAHPALYDRGWHPTAVCGALGAAVTSSRLLGLEAAGERTAVALALLRSAGLRSGFGSAGKSLQVGMAASAGVAAAKLAEAGARVDLDQVVSGPGGFEGAFGARFERPSGAAAVEQNWIKAYPCCLQTHAVIEAAIAARESGADLDGGSGGTPIEVTVAPVSLQAAWVAEPSDGLEAKFSIPYLAAFALLHGAPDVASFGGLDDGAMALAERVAVRGDPGVADSEALLSVGGESFRVEAPLGCPQRPMTAEALAAKRRGLAGERLEGALDDPARPAGELLKALRL
jgi:2-methylcitrate dehydratase PrpD